VRPPASVGPRLERRPSVDGLFCGHHTVGEKSVVEIAWGWLQNGIRQETGRQQDCRKVAAIGFGFFNPQLPGRSGGMPATEGPGWLRCAVAEAAKFPPRTSTSIAE
jgi:hypothetical protein